MLMVDSGIWIDYFSRHESHTGAWLQQCLLENERNIVVGDLVLHEVLRGIRHDTQYRAVHAVLIELPCYTLGGSELAILAAAHYRVLREQGITIRKTVDVLLASWCIQTQTPLLANDRDFFPFVQLGLVLVDVNQH